MAKATGFLEYDLRLPKKENPKQRVKNYEEFVGMYSDIQLHEQAARCMDCGIPFCHSGCPLGNVIPEFNSAVYDGKWEEAYEILASTNNFPEFTGRVCPAPCESACVLGINNSPVAIEEIERHIAEIAFKKGFVKPPARGPRTGKTVAIIGSGPAGLAAAEQLVKAGHDVVVYEKDDKPGGLLRYGIPDFKLEKGFVERRIALMEKSGVRFVNNAAVGENVPSSELYKYDAVILAGGSLIPRDLDIPGRSLKGIHFAMDYLVQQNKRVGGEPVDGEDILATGKNVLVIGDGDTGIDCVGTANRQNPKSLTQLARKAKLPEQRTPAMPWPMHPTLFHVASSHEEGGERIWNINTKRFLGDEDGQVRAVLVSEFEWENDEMGRPIRAREIAGSEREIPCELVTLALGFTHPKHEGLLNQLGVALDESGNVRATEQDFQTSVDKFFVAGDMRRGQSLVVWAISEGRECARKVDQYLMGHSDLESKDAVFESV